MASMVFKMSRPGVCLALAFSLTVVQSGLISSLAAESAPLPGSNAAAQPSRAVPVKAEGNPIKAGSNPANTAGKPAKATDNAVKAAATLAKSGVQQPKLDPGASAPAPGPSPDPTQALKSSMPPVAPARPAAAAAKAPAKAPASAKAAANSSTSAKYAQVSELEKLMFGEAHANIPIEYRLDRLESEVFHHTNPEWEPTKRIDRLNETLIGGGKSTSPTNTAGSGSQAVPSSAQAPYPPGQLPPNLSEREPPLPPELVPPLNSGLPAPLQSESQPYYGASSQDLNSPEFQKVIPRGQLEQYGLQEINAARATRGLGPLEWDELAYKVATSLVNDLCKRNTVAHQNAAGENPDVRYTKAGGTDSIVESIIAEKTSTKPTPNKAMVYKTISLLMKNQDDREAFFSPHATGLALNFNLSSARDKLITCFEVVTKHAEISEIPNEVKVGDKIEVTGVMRPGYTFKKITVAWEGLDSNGASDAEEQDEALPYFAPLDYEAFARKSEHDWDKATRLLQMGGIGLALAGGIFIPPVALAAPLIAASAGTMKPHAVSDIPVRGGVRVDGAMFTHRVPISKNDKDGIYYITIWATTDSDDKPVPISRRAVIAKASSATVSAEPAKDGHKDGKGHGAGSINEKPSANDKTSAKTDETVHVLSDKALLSENNDEHSSKKSKRLKDKKRAKGISAEQKTEPNE